MSLRRTATITALAAIAIWSCWLAASAEASFTSFRLASSDPQLKLQADFAYEPAVSANGRYVAFVGIVASKAGIFRKNLQTEELAAVALGRAIGGPSISADGRYVSFTAAEDLTTGAPSADGCTQVYVRDMELGPARPASQEALGTVNGAYELASVPVQATEPRPIAYEGAGEEGCPGGGSTAARAVALSADGRKVAFTTIGRSDLTAGAQELARGATPTPPLQVAVRDLQAGRTTLVSATLNSISAASRGESVPQEPVPEGAAVAGVPQGRVFPGLHGKETRLGEEAASTAAISADGTTAAWMGIDVAAQAPLTRAPRVGYPAGYAEPLWRRIADGPGAPTRRVLAGDDPSAAGCPPECPGGLDLAWDPQVPEPTLLPQGPQYGSYVAQFFQGFPEGSPEIVTPALSADGSRVAIVSTQPDYGRLPDFGRLDPTKAPTTNAFVVNMEPGLTRGQAIARLTEWASPDFSNAVNNPIRNIAISGDGTRVLFTTARNAFPLAPPTLITAPVTQLQPAVQLYEVNLLAGSLALVSQGYDGEPANREDPVGGIRSAALSADGRVVALASGSSNLAYGMVNSGSAVLVTEEEDSAAQAGHQSVSALPAQASAETTWQISATAHPARDGSLLIDVSIPGAGVVSASASAPVPVTAAYANGPHSKRSGTSSSGRTASGRTASSTRGRRAVRGTRRAGPTTIAVRQVARAQLQAGDAGVVELRLAPAAAYRPLANEGDGLFATVLITFSSPGHARLTATLQAALPRSAASPRRKPRAAARGQRSRRTRTRHRA